MLQLEHLNVAVPDMGQRGNREVVHDLSLTVPEGELHVLLGANGSGKSSLLAAIMGLAPYEVTGGDVRLNGESLLGLGPDERATRGIAMGFQRPPVIDGVTVDAFAAALGASDTLAQEVQALDLAGFGARALNDGFSGGETKRWEVLKLFLQDPIFALFDEPESGVDVEHLRAVGQAVNRLMQTPDSKGRARSGLVITHTGLILDHVDVAIAHVMHDGHIIRSGPPREVFDRIQSYGYGAA